MCIGGLIGSCLGSFCAGCCCAGCSDCKAKRGPASRIPYIFLTFIACIFAVIMSLYGEKQLYQNSLLDIDLHVCNSDSCLGNGSVYRTSFSLALFFAIHSVVVYFILSFHWLFLIIKLMCFATFLTITFWIPSSVFDGYSYFARVASVFFLMLQIIILINWAYNVNDTLVNRAYSEDAEDSKAKQNSYIGLLLCVTLVFITITIVLWVFFFQWFVPEDTCEFNQAIIAITIVSVIIIFIASLRVPHGSIFTTSIVSFYCTYLCYSALESYPSVNCNTLSNASNTSTTRNSLNMWIGIIITAAAISYAGYGVSSNNNNNDNNQISKNESAHELEAGEDKTTDDNPDAVVAEKKKTKSVVDDDNDDHVGFRGQLSEADQIEKSDNVKFHMCMAGAAIYMSMLYTNWGTNTTDENTARARGDVSLWVNITAQWLTFILYFWTLVAPLVCPSRFQNAED